MSVIRNFFKRFFVDGMVGLSIGLFATVVAGTILETIGLVMGGAIGQYIALAASLVKLLIGIGIGVGVATKLGAPPCVVVCSAITGYIGAYAYNIINGTHFVNGAINIKEAGDPLTAYLAAYITVEIGCLIANKTRLNYVITPIITIIIGSAVSFYVAQPLNKVTEIYGNIINWWMKQNSFVMSIIVAVLMGLSMTLPISSMALALTLNMSGAVAAAAAVGCCVNMIGFATSSFRDNKIEGFILQGLGTPTIQFPNIVKKPIICLPVIITSAILGPISVCVFHMTSEVTAAGLGSCGFTSQIMTYQTMVNAGVSRNMVLIEIVLLQFLLPAVLTWIISEFMRKRGFIKEDDMKISF